MFTAKRRGFIALLAALLLAALIAFGISMLPAASRTASAETTKSVSDAGTLLNAFREAGEGDTIQLTDSIELDMEDKAFTQAMPGGHMVIASKDALLELYKDENITDKQAEEQSVANNITLDLNQNTLTLKTTSDFGCIAVYGVNLTVKNGTINGESKAGLAVVGNAGGDNGALTVEDTTINFKNLDTQAQSAAPVISGEGELTLSNVTYELSAAEGAQEPVAPYVAKIGGKGYSSVAEAISAAQSSDTIQLTANIDESITIPSGKEIAINLNGKKITGNESNLINVKSGGTLTISDSSNENSGSISNSGSGAAIFNSGTLNITGGTIESAFTGNSNLVYAVNVNDGTATITGATLKAASSGKTAVNVAGSDTTNPRLTLGDDVTVEGAVSSGKNAAVTITGGNYTNATLKQTKGSFSISGGTFKEVFSPAWLVEGYAIYQDGGNYTVKDVATAGGDYIVSTNSVAQSNGKYYDSLQDAFKEASKDNEIALIKDVFISEQLAVGNGKTVNLNLNGHSIAWGEQADGNKALITLGNSFSKLTITGSGNVNAGEGVNPISAGSGTVLISGGTYSARVPAEWLSDGYTLSLVANGYSVIQADSVAVLISGDSEYKFDTLRTAFAAAQDGETITLTKDKITINNPNNAVSYTENEPLDKELTLDLCGKTIIATHSTYAIEIVTTKDFTIKNGTFDLDKGRALSVSAAGNASINVIIKDITVNGETAVSNNSSINVIAVNGSTTNAVLENVDINVAANTANVTIAINAQDATLSIRNSSVNIQNVASISSANDTIALMATNCEMLITDSIFNSDAGAAILFYGNYATGADAEAAGVAGYNKLTLSGVESHGYTFGLSGYGEAHGTIINIEGSKLSGTIGAGIFHPQVGILNILGNGNVISGTSAIELRGGSLNIEGGVFTATSTALYISDNPGSGSTIDGAAIVVSQHGYDPAIQVSIAGGVFNGLYALYEDDLVNEEGTEDIQISVSGGMYNGEVYSQNKSGFVTGGTFAALDGEYIAPGYAFDEATGTVVSATLNNNALAGVRAYLAAYGLLYGDIKDLAAAETPDALAQAIVNAYEAIATATGEEAIAVAKMDALDAIDAFIGNLNTVKAEAIAELEELIMEPVDVTEGGEVIKEAVVAMPTYIVSAINGAKSAAEVEKYVAVATAEINELIDMREQAADDQLALENQLNSIISALGIVQQAGGSWSSSFLAGIEESVNTAKDNILTISSLLGRPTDEATAETIFGKLEEANANIQGVYDKLSAEISAMLTGEGGISSQLEELKELVDENSALAADIDNVLATAGRIEGALGNINSNNTLSNVLEQMNNLVSDYQSTVTNAILNISTRLDQLQQNMPTDSTIANALRSVIAGVENDLDILKAEVDALDEPNGALVTAINEKIEAAFESFGNTFTSELDKLNGTIAGLDTAIDNLPETLDVEGIRQAIADAKSAAEAAGTKVDALTGEEGALTTIDGKIDAIDGVVDGIADAQESMGNALTTFATATDTALKGIQSDIDGLESKLNAMANTAATDKADILAKIAELKSAADDISEAIASLDGDSAEDLSGIAEDLAALQTALDGVKADIGNVSQQVGGVAEDNTNSMSNFAGLYLFLSALVVLAIAILIVVSVKKRR